MGVRENKEKSGQTIWRTQSAQQNEVNLVVAEATSPSLFPSQFVQRQQTHEYISPRRNQRIRNLLRRQ
jgi:hypothetical protein